MNEQSHLLKVYIVYVNTEAPFLLERLKELEAILINRSSTIEGIPRLQLFLNVLKKNMGPQLTSGSRLPKN